MISLLNKYVKSIHFSKPSTADIIIFDETHSSLLENVIPDGLTTSIFKMRPMEFYITPLILFNFIRNLKNFKFRSGVASSRGWFYKIFWQLLCIYIKADLSSRNPRAIITFIDNCKKFAWLSENFNKIPCIAVQNGFRSYYAANDEDSYYCQHLFCFGERERESYPKMGYKVDNFYPVGSLLLSNGLDNLVISNKPTYDLLIVSCWRGNIGFAQDVKDSMKAMRLMDEALAEYLKSRKLTAGIIMRSERDSFDWIIPQIGMSEEDYYKSIYGDLTELIDTNFSERNIYQVMESADLLLAGFGTTCLLEGYSMGKKILYINLSGVDKYYVDFDSKIVFKGSSEEYLRLESELDGLIDCSKDLYLKKHQKLMDYYMKNSNSKFTQEQIKKKIMEIVA